jgi:hypothetical protein
MLQDVQGFKLQHVKGLWPVQQQGSSNEHSGLQAANHPKS